MSIYSDNLRTTLRCVHTGENADVLLQLDVRDVLRGREVRVGDDFVIDWDTLTGGGYYALVRPADGEPCRFVQRYECDRCEARDSWAEIVVADGKLQSAEAVVLDRAVIERIHAIDDMIAHVYEAKDVLPFRGGIERLHALCESERRAFLLAHVPADLDAPAR